MPDQSLAQLLKEARDFSDYQKVEARVAEQFISRDEAMGALLRLAERVEALESWQPEAPPDPRPPTRLGDEFPEPVADEELERSRQRSRASKLVEQFHAGELGASPPSKAVRVDSLPVGARCWVEATVQQDRDADGDVYLEPVVANPDGYHFWLDREALVIPAEPSAKEYNGGMATLLPWEIEARRIHAAEKPIAESSGTAPIREVTIPRNDTGNSGSRTSPPTPLQLRVGHRYKRADGKLADALRWYPDGDKHERFELQTVGTGQKYWADERGRVSNAEELGGDIVEDLGPVAKESKTVPRWALDPAVADYLRKRAAGQTHFPSGVPQKARSEVLRRVEDIGNAAQAARDMLRELGEVKP